MAFARFGGVVLNVFLLTGSLLAGGSKAADQLRAITEAIKQCPARSGQPGDTSCSSPLNVVWDIEQKHSARSEEMGYIEFVRTCHYNWKDQEECKKRDADCQRRNTETLQLNVIADGAASALPDQFRYEFDVNDGGVELVRVLSKHQSKDEPWSASSLQASSCVANAISTVQSNRRQ